jgi:hypothetical protein
MMDLRMRFHPDGSINVILKSGVVRLVKPGDPLYQRALDETTDE